MTRDNSAGLGQACATDSDRAVCDWMRNTVWSEMGMAWHGMA